MTNILPRLRRLAGEKGHAEDPVVRDELIAGFLKEIDTVVCQEVLAALADPVLSWLYYDWVQAILAHECEQTRRQRLITTITVIPRSYVPESQAAPNVHSLFG